MYFSLRTNDQISNLHELNFVFQEQIPLSTDDFYNHIQKRNHKDKESSLKLQNQNDEHAESSVPIAPFIHTENDANSMSCYQRINIEANSNNNIPFHNESNSCGRNSVDSSSNSSKQRSIDDYMMKLSYSHPEATKSHTYELSEASLDSFKNLKDAITNMKYTNDRLRTKTISVHSNPASLLELANVIADVKVSQAIPPKAVDLTSRMIRRTFDEIEITALLMQYLNIFDSNLKMTPFGSSTYGFGGSNTNFNVLVKAGNTAICYNKTDICKIIK